MLLLRFAPTPSYFSLHRSPCGGWRFSLSSVLMMLKDIDCGAGRRRRVPSEGSRKLFFPFHALTPVGLFALGGIE